MSFDFMTREVWDTLILAVIVIGSALAAVRLYRDFTQPLPTSQGFDEDTQPRATATTAREDDSPRA